MCEEEAAADKLQTDHKHPFPHCTVWQGGRRTSWEGRSDGKPGRKYGVEDSVAVICPCFTFPKPVYLVINESQFLPSQVHFTHDSKK